MTNWNTVDQSTLRSAIRDGVNTGTIKVNGISIQDFRNLVNGMEADGIRLSTVDLRKIGARGCYEHRLEIVDDYEDEPTEPTETSADEPVVLNEPPNIGTALQQLQQAIAASNRPEVNKASVERIAFDVMTNQFERMHKEQMESSGEMLDEIIQESVSKYASSEVKATVSAIIHDEFGASVRSELDDGTKTLLPQIHPVDPAFCENGFTDQVDAALQGGFHLLVGGPSGCGKTYPIIQMLNKAGRRFIKINCADGVSMSELLAERTIEVEDGHPVMRVILKALPICMREGIPLLMDEIDKLPDEILSIIYPATDAQPAVITIPQTGERIVAKAGFQVIATCNGLGDETGLYSGHQISAALKTRFISIQASYLSRREETDILKKDGLSDAQASSMIDTFEKLRKAHDEGVLSLPPSTRTMLLMSKLMQGKDIAGNVIPGAPERTESEALETCVFGMLPKSESTAVSDALNA